MNKFKTWHDFFEAEKDEKKLYIIGTKSAEDRGGTCKPASIKVSESYEKLSEDGENVVYEVRNGALFPLPSDYEEDEKSEIQKLIDLASNPDTCSTITNFIARHHQWIKKDRTGCDDKVQTILSKVMPVDGWWTLVGYGDGYDDEDEDEDIDTTKELLNGYLVVKFGRKIESWRFDKFSYAFKVWWGISGEDSDSNEQYDLFKLKDGEAILLASSASISTESDFKTTGFSCYDYAFNPYREECSHGCKYCYSCKGGIKDFRCLPEDLIKRVVIGSHIDPYHTLEQTEFKTQEILKTLVNKEGVTKVGIFTKSPLILRDLELIKKLPNPVIHLGISPFPEDIRRKLEPGAPPNEERIKAARQIKAFGIKLVINFCPCMPIISDGDIIEFNEVFELADEICIGLTCLYGSIPEELEKVVPGMTKNIREGKWAKSFMKKMQKELRIYSDKKLIIWRDTSRKGWKNLMDQTLLPQEYYQQ